MSEFLIYLAEQPGAALDVVQHFRRDHMAESKKWADWAKQYAPQTKGAAIGRDGYCYGFEFPVGQLPDNWRKPDKNGYSWPKVKHPVRTTLPENIRLRNELEYIREHGLEIPTSITFFKDGEKSRSFGIGHWFNPVQFIYFGEEVGQCGIVTPNYEDDLGKAALGLKEGETMQPPIDFDWQNLLPGCRLIRKYEWDYLYGKFKKEQENDTAI